MKFLKIEDSGKDVKWINIEAIDYIRHFNHNPHSGKSVIVLQGCAIQVDYPVEVVLQKIKEIQE